MFQKFTEIDAFTNKIYILIHLIYKRSEFSDVFFSKIDSRKPLMTLWRHVFCLKHVVEGIKGFRVTRFILLPIKTCGSVETAEMNAIPSVSQHEI
jgi:hypothetical protein